MHKKISHRAKVIRSLLAISAGNKYSAARIKSHRQAFERTLALLFPAWRAKQKRAQIAGVDVAWVTPSGATERTIVYLHGGGFVLGSVKSHRQHIKRLATLCKARVLAIDYSLAPENPYPAALDEVQKVWEWLSKQDDFDPKQTVIAGDSAGGSLALGSALRFRDAGLPQPACLVLLSPALDAMFSGQSYRSHNDVMLNDHKLEFFASSYIQQNSRKIPYISPVYADLTGLPPFLVHIGSEEMILSDSTTIVANAARDGVPGSLYIGEGMWHGWHFFASYMPEAKVAMKKIAEYVIAHTKV